VNSKAARHSLRPLTSEFMYSPVGFVNGKCG
jgi:hypothetical protein